MKNEKKQNKFEVGDWVYIGTEGGARFQVKAFGHCSPMASATIEDEFIQLQVPGMMKAVFNIHQSYVFVAKFAQDGV